MHTGGVDHIAVHHTNEVAQSECGFGVHPWVRYWLHNEFLDLGGVKMSKSAGGTVLLDDLVAKGIEPLAYRYFFLQARYRSQQALSDAALQAAAAGLRNLRSRALDARAAGGDVDLDRVGPWRDRFWRALGDDLDAPEALAVASNVVKAKELTGAERWALLVDFDDALGLGVAGWEKDEAPDAEVPDDVLALLDERAAARVRQGLGPGRRHPRRADRRRLDDRRHARRRQGHPLTASSGSVDAGGRPATTCVHESGREAAPAGYPASGRRARAAALSWRFSAARLDRALPVRGADQLDGRAHQRLGRGGGVGDARRHRRRRRRSAARRGRPRRARPAGILLVISCSWKGRNVMPRSTSGRQNQPRSVFCTRRSWASTAMAPAPKAWPLSAATVGSRKPAAGRGWWPCSRGTRRGRRRRSAPMNSRSKPLQ